MNLEELSQRLTLDVSDYVRGFQQAQNLLSSFTARSTEAGASILTAAKNFEESAKAAQRLESALKKLHDVQRQAGTLPGSGPASSLFGVPSKPPESDPLAVGRRIRELNDEALRKQRYMEMAESITVQNELDKARDAKRGLVQRYRGVRTGQYGHTFGLMPDHSINNKSNDIIQDIMEGHLRYSADRRRGYGGAGRARGASAAELDEVFGPVWGMTRRAANTTHLNSIQAALSHRSLSQPFFSGYGWQAAGNVAHGMGSMISGTARGVTGAVGGLFDTSSTAGLLMTITGITAAVFTLRAAFHGVSDAIHKVVENGMEFERMRVTFEVLSRDVEKGRTLFGELQQMSVRTPFTFKQLGDTSQLLLGMGVSPENAPGMLSRMTDVAAGDPGRLRRLAFAMGASGAEGRLTGQRVRQFASLGIGIPDFAKTMGISGGEFRERMHGGGIPSFYVEETIKRMTDSGGRFFERNERGLETVSGQWNRLGGIIDLLAGKFGEAMMSSMGLAKGIKDVGDLLLTLMPSAERFGKSFGGFLGAGMQEAGALGGGFFAGAGKFLGRHHDDIVGAMPGMDQVMSGLHRFGDALLWITDLIGTIGANMIKGAGEAAKYAIIGYAHLSHSLIGKLMGMEPMTMDQGKAAMSFMAPILKFTRGAPGAWNEFMGDVRGEVDSRRHPTITSRIFAGAERFLGGLGGRPGFTPNTQSTIDNLESDIVKNKMSSDPMFAFMHERNNLMDEYWGRGGKVGAEKSAGAWRQFAPMLGLDPGLFHAMPGGPLAGAPGLVKERGALLFETLEKSVSPLLNFRDHLAPVAMAGSGEAADAIAKAQLDFKSVEEEVLAVVQTANEMHAHASARLDEIAAALQNNKLLMVEK